MDDAQSFKGLFGKWPQGTPRRGVLVTHFGEQIPFSDFFTSDELLLIERQNPDSLGARQLIVPYSQIASLKITEVVPMKKWRTLGFVEPS